eukprot:TRINITY_DN3023_c0_g1_i1.p1 TRINITY_DN3023_c0_g1~~TRINITY_DN3023_c0_g1_i1.p1  ORF type:complete len:114 (-),score=12.06 TRINITY_DN3023_c0_g1_i1:104-445(-)
MANNMGRRRLAGVWADAVLYDVGTNVDPFRDEEMDVASIRQRWPAAAAKIDEAVEFADIHQQVQMCHNLLIGRKDLQPNQNRYHGYVAFAALCGFVRYSQKLPDSFEAAMRIR